MHTLSHKVTRATQPTLTHMKAVLPDVDETAGGQVYFIGQELQQLHSIIQTQMTVTEKTNHFR